jgi:hypothetical protein
MLEGLNLSLAPWRRGRKEEVPAAAWNSER